VRHARLHLLLVHYGGSQRVSEPDADSAYCRRRTDRGASRRGTSLSTRIINIEDFRLTIAANNHGFRTSHDTTCPHQHLFFNESGQTVECQDCKKQVTAWWALMAMSEGLKRMREKLDAEREALDAEIAKNVTHKAALKVEHAWRRHNMLPCCPHCLHAIRPEDGFGDRCVSKADPEGARRSMIRISKVLGLPTGEV
jgi:hypothetical protein